MITELMVYLTNENLYLTLQELYERNIEFGFINVKNTNFFDLLFINWGCKIYPPYDEIPKTLRIK